MIKSYNELTVGKYVEIRELLKEEMEDIDLQVAIISILSDKPVEEIVNLPMTEYSKYAADSNFLINKPNFKPQCPNSIVLNGKKYNVISKVEKLTAGQYIDFNNYMKAKDPESKLAEVLSIFIIPEGKKYNEGYDIEDVQNAIREYMPVSIAIGISFFFRNRSLISLKVMLTFLRWKMIWMRMMSKDKTVKERLKEVVGKLKEMEALQKDMVG